MGWAYGNAPREVLWVGFRAIPYFVMPVAFVLLACGYGRNPTMVGAEKLLKSEDPARGDLKSLVFFGGLLLVAALGTILMDARKSRNPDFARFAAVTSNIPFVAVVQGRNRVRWREIGWKRPAIGLAAFALVLLVHP